MERSTWVHADRKQVPQPRWSCRCPWSNFQRGVNYSFSVFFSPFLLQLMQMNKHKKYSSLRFRTHGQSCRNLRVWNCWLTSEKLFWILARHRAVCRAVLPPGCGLRGGIANEQSHRAAGWGWEWFPRQQRMPLPAKIDPVAVQCSTLRICKALIAFIIKALVALMIHKG